MGGSGAFVLYAAMVAVMGLLMVVSTAADAGNFSKEVAALVAVKAALQDPSQVLGDWDVDKSGDNPCNWSTVFCHRGQLFKLKLKQVNLSGELSPAIGRLTSLRFLILSHNAISGPIPETIAGMQQLQRLDLSNNQFTGNIPSTLGALMKLQYLELNKNNLSGSIPESLVTARNISSDLSCNNLSGPRPMFRASIVTLQGNPLLSDINCRTAEPGAGSSVSRGNCSYAKEEHGDDLPPPMSSPTTTQASKRDTEEDKAYILYIIVLSISVICLAAVFITGLILLLRRRRHQPPQVFAVVDAENGPESHLNQYKLEEIKKATTNFSRENILGEGGFGIVYKGLFPDGTIVAVKRLKRRLSAAEDDQFKTEVEVTSLVAHRNLLHLIGFCTTEDERILVYPFMPNGTVASNLQEQVDGAPALDWPRRKIIALGAARGLRCLHEQCDQKIIHCDIKAANILLDEYLEALVADFGLAKLLDHGVSHIVTVVRGTFGCIPPEGVLGRRLSEKTDIFGFGLLLIEIITGRRTQEVIDGDEYEEGGIFKLAKECLEKNQLSSFIDSRLGNNYDSAELEELVQIALLCTMYSPEHRPQMSEVVRMLEGGGGVTEKWEALKDVQRPTSPSPELALRAICYDSDQGSSVEQQPSELSGPR